MLASRPSTVQENNHPTVLLLPPEILLLVVYYHSIDDPPTMYERNHSTVKPMHAIKQKLGWIGITHVSHYLRTTTISDNRLWRTIAFTLGPAWVDLMLSRAQGHPLIFKGAFTNLLHSESLMMRAMLAFANDPSKFNRVATIDLTGSLYALRPLTACLSQHAGLLETISISLPPDAAPGKWLVLPEDMTVGKPALRHVSFHGCVFTWTALRFSTLEYLCVTMPTAPSGSGGASRLVINQIPTYGDLIDLLDRLKWSLHTLILKECLPCRLFGGSVEPVSLRRLRLIEIVGEMSDCLDIISAIIIPVSADLHLACSDLRGYMPNLSPLTPFVRTYLETCKASGRLPQTIMLCPARGLNAPFEMSLWDNIYPSSVVSSGYAELRPFFRLTLSWTGHSTLLRRVTSSTDCIPKPDLAIARRLLPAIPLMRVRTFVHALVSDEGARWGIADTLQNVLIHAPLLEDLQLSGAAVRSWISALANASRYTTRLPSLHSLRKLRLIRADLSLSSEGRNQHGGETLLDDLRWTFSVYEYAPRLQVSFIECCGTGVDVSF